MYPFFEENGRSHRASHFYFASLQYNLLFSIIILLILLVFSKSVCFAQSPISEYNPAGLTASNNGIFFYGKTFWGNNSLPLRAIFFDKWGGPFNPELINRSDNYWKTNADYIYNQWRLAGFYRGELFAEANRDTVEILRMINLKQELPEGRDFEINLKAGGFSAAGIEMSKGVSLGGILEGLSTGFTVRYLRGEKIQEGTISGRITTTDVKSYDFDLMLDYIYDDNLIYNSRNINSGTGDGHSMDIGLRYDIKSNCSAEILFRDLYGRIYWRDIPYTTASATSDIKSYDKDGYQVYQPSIHGYESYKDFTQKIPVKTDMSISYKKGNVTLIPIVNLIESRPVYWIETDYELSNNRLIMAGYNINYNAFSVGYALKKTSVNIYLSDIDLFHINAIGLVLSYQAY